MSNWPTNGNLTGKLSVGQGKRGKSLEYMWRGTELGIRREDEEEYQFVNLAGGGAGNSGADGREIELQVNSGFIQWRYVGAESWNNLIALSILEGKQGPKGDKGERGEKGEQGLQGLPGKDGKNGIDGTNGKDGITPNISIGTVTTLEAGEQATVVNSGTKENPVFDFGIPKGADSVAIDDTIIATETTWSSSKIEDFVHTNDDVIWSTVQGENLSIDYTKEGYLREIEICGNTWQNEEDLSNIQHLGELYVDEKEEPILDKEGKKQYKVKVKSCNENLFDGELINGWYSTNTGVYVYVSKGNVCNKNRIQVSPNMTVYSNKVNLIRICEYDKNNKFLKNGVDYGDGVTLTNNTKYINLYYNNEGNTDDTVIISYKKPKSYIPHKSHKTTLLLPCQLMKVGDITDRLYWDEENNKYIIEKNIIETKYADKTGWRVWYHSDSILRFALTPKHKPIMGSNIKILSNKVPSVGYNIQKKNIYISNNVIELILNREDLEHEGLDALNAWLLSKELLVYYPLATPQLIDTGIREELKLPTFINNTYITVNGEIQGTIKAKAPVDGGKVISVLQDKNTELETINNIQDELINTTMLATDEMYMMLEPLLAETLGERSVSKMVDMYVAMVQRGIKTIEQVPVRYREQVKKILDQLEK